VRWLNQPRQKQKAFIRHRAVAGQFDEDVEGIGIASDVINVEVDDPATPFSPLPPHSTRVTCAPDSSSGAHFQNPRKPAPTTNSFLEK